jgi:outer membrane protein assembly factor BamD (BamD/ComL family)
MYFYRERCPEAIQTLRRLAEGYPKCSVAEDALYIVAESYRRQKDLPEAQKWFREVLKRYPDTPASDDAQAALEEIARDPTMLFREDRRLDVTITLNIPPGAPIEDVLQWVSVSSGVPFHVAPELRQTRLWARPGSGDAIPNY